MIFFSAEFYAIHLIGQEREKLFDYVQNGTGFSLHNSSNRRFGREEKNSLAYVHDLERIVDVLKRFCVLMSKQANPSSLLENLERIFGQQRKVFAVYVQSADFLEIF